MKDKALRQLEVMFKIYNIISGIGEDATVKEKIESIIDFLDDGCGYNATLETIVLNEVAQKIEFFAYLGLGAVSLENKYHSEVGVKSISPMEIAPGMYRVPEGLQEPWLGQKKWLRGSARIINYALSIAGLETKLLPKEPFAGNKQRYALVVYL